VGRLVPELVLQPDPFGDVDQQPHHAVHGAVGIQGGGGGQLHVDLHAVTASARQMHNRQAVAVVQPRKQTWDVEVAVGQAGQRSAQHVLGPVAEQLLGGPVPLPDPAGPIQLDQRGGAGVDDGAQPSGQRGASDLLRSEDLAVQPGVLDRGVAACSTNISSRASWSWPGRSPCSGTSTLSTPSSPAEAEASGANKASSGCQATRSSPATRSTQTDSGTQVGMALSSQAPSRRWSTRRRS